MLSPPGRRDRPLVETPHAETIGRPPPSQQPTWTHSWSKRVVRVRNPRAEAERRHLPFVELTDAHVEWFRFRDSSFGLGIQYMASLHAES